MSSITHYGASSRDIVRLFRFMLLFQIDRFWLLHATNEQISARVGFPPEEDFPNAHYDPEVEVQELVWDIQEIDDDALLLVEYLIDHQLVDIDKITVSSDELRARMDWPAERLEKAIDSLLSVRVDMVDNGERTDFYFIHF